MKAEIYAEKSILEFDRTVPEARFIFKKISTLKDTHYSAKKVEVGSGS